MFQNVNKTKGQHGFTLIELMIVVAILSIIAMLAAPGFSEYMKNNQLKTSAQDIHSLIRTARAEAMIKGVDIHVGLSDSTDTSWNAPLAAWVDSGSTANQLDATDEVIYRTTTSGGVSVATTGLTNSKYFIFRSDGNQSNSVAMTFKLCDGRTGETGRLIQVIATGLSSISEDSSC